MAESTLDLLNEATTVVGKLKTYVLDDASVLGYTRIDVGTAGVVVSMDASNPIFAQLTAGSASIGTLAANSGVDIGDVDILSIAAGDNNIGNVDIVTLPAGNLGQQAMAASLSVVPASDITDPTYIGDIKFGEALPAGSAIIGNVRIDQTVPGTTNGVVEASAAAIKTAVELIDNAISGAGFNITEFGGAAVPIGAGIEATAIRVTLPTDGTGLLAVKPDALIADTVSSTISKANVYGASHSFLRGYSGTTYERIASTGGAIHIHDGGSSVTVDNAAVDAINAKLVTGTIIGAVEQSGAWVVDLGANNDVTLATLPDTAAGDLAAINAALAGTLTVTGGGGGTEYTEDAPSAADPVGTALILKRADTPATIGVDDDNVALRGTAYGAAYAQIIDSSGNFIDSFGGSGGTSSADDADFVAGTTLGTIVQGVYESSPTSVTDGDVGAIGITSTREAKTSDATAAALLTTIDADTGTILTSNAAILVDTTSIDGKITACDTGAVVIASGTLTTVSTVTNLSQMNGAAITMGNGVSGTGVQRVTIASDSTGTVGLAAGSATVGKVNVPAVATGGATPGKLISAATTNATSVKASAGTLYSLSVGNTNAAARYVKFYDKASAPTVGTDTPVQVFLIPGNTAGAGREVQVPVCGIAFSTGIAYATTTGAADSDTGAVAANEIVASYSYL